MSRDVIVTAYWSYGIWVLFGGLAYITLKTVTFRLTAKTRALVILPFLTVLILFSGPFKKARASNWSHDPSEQARMVGQDLGHISLSAWWCASLFSAVWALRRKKNPEQGSPSLSGAD